MPYGLISGLRVGYARAISGRTGEVRAGARCAAVISDEDNRSVCLRVDGAFRAGAFAALAGVTTTLASVLIGLAAPAVADSGADFLAVISKTGINVGDSPADVVLTLSRGMLACRLLHYGYPTEVAIREVGYGFPGATPAQLAGFVDAAKAKLCEPNFRQLNPGGY